MCVGVRIHFRHCFLCNWNSHSGKEYKSNNDVGVVRAKSEPVGGSVGLP